ncbi:MAG: hypothetical protein M1480_18810 [Bacteroidetes bacterium]|nr:hypothetical protein [Bacteroidota bacterium]
MKKYFLIAFVFLLSLNLFAQYENYPIPGKGNLNGGLGLNWIDGQLYYRFHFMPEISFANFGVGLDLNVDIDKNGNIRKEDFNELSDYLSIIRYVRYGLKHDPVFIKLGALDYYNLGHGSIMYQYNNSPSIDTRKIGLVADIDFGEFGFESIYSTFAEAGVTAVRGYVRPLKFSSLADVPIISNLEVGGTYAADFNKYSGVVFHTVYIPSLQVPPAPVPPIPVTTSEDKGRMQIVGLDLGLPIIRSSMFDLQLYADYAKIINYGSGVATGIMVDVNGLGILNASAKLERRFNNAQYIPSYFNSMYEIERYRVDTSNGSYSYTSKATLLSSITNPDNGYFGELDLHFLGLLDVIGSYQRLDKTPNSGVLHLVANVSPEGMPVVVRGGYDKINIGAESQIFRVDNNSFMYFELGYKPLPYIIVSMLYRWTFTPIRDSNDNIIDYQPQKRIEPRISFEYPFSFGQGN